MERTIEMAISNLLAESHLRDLLNHADASFTIYIRRYSGGFEVEALPNDEGDPPSDHLKFSLESMC